MAILTNAEILTHMQLTGVITTLQQAVLTQLRPAAERLVKEHVGYEIEQATHIEFHPVLNRSVEGDPMVEGYEGSTGGAVPVYWGQDDARSIYLDQLPLRSITSVCENISAWDTAGGSWPAGNDLSEGADFRADYELVLSGQNLSWSGALVKNYGTWPRVARSVRVEYVAGLSATELDFDGRYGVFKQAALLTCQINFLEALSNTINDQSGGAGTGVINESLDGWSVSYSGAMVEALFSMQSTLPEKAKQMLQPYVRMSRFLGV